MHLKNSILRRHREIYFKFTPRGWNIEDLFLHGGYYDMSCIATDSQSHCDVLLFATANVTIIIIQQIISLVLNLMQ